MANANLKHVILSIDRVVQYKSKWIKENSLIKGNLTETNIPLSKVLELCREYKNEIDTLNWVNNELKRIYNLEKE